MIVDIIATPTGETNVRHPRFATNSKQNDNGFPSNKMMLLSI
jgi:hypothetical protein